MWWNKSHDRTQWGASKGWAGNLCDSQGSRFLEKKEPTKIRGGLKFGGMIVCRNMPKLSVIFFQDSLWFTWITTWWHWVTTWWIWELASFQLKWLESRKSWASRHQRGEVVLFLKSYISESQVLAAKRRPLGKGTTIYTNKPSILSFHVGIWGCGSWGVIPEKPASNIPSPDLMWDGHPTFY